MKKDKTLNKLLSSLLWNISSAKIDVSYIFSISKKRYVAKSEFLRRCMFRFSRFYFVKEMYVTISGKMSKNFRKIQQKYEKSTFVLLSNLLFERVTLFITQNFQKNTFWSFIQILENKIIVTWVFLIQNGTIFANSADFLQEYADITKILNFNLLKGVLSKNYNLFLLTNQISSFQHKPNEF